jgi:LysR family nitrogen assimilation transcriptional regulator
LTPYRRQVGTPISLWRSAIPSLRQFRYFARIVELGSVTRASEHLNVAQTALGSQIRQLEEELGVVLLQRHSRGVSVTKAGEFLYRHVQIILADVDRCLREIAELRSEKTESLKFGASGSVVQLVGSDLLARAHEAIPNVSITLVEDTSRKLFEALKRGEVDMMLAHDLPEERGLTRTPWVKEELLFFTAGNGTARIGSASDISETISFADALENELTLPARLDGIRKIIETAAGPLDLKCKVTYQVQSSLALKLLIADTAVASVLPYGLAVNELRGGALRARRIVEPTLHRTLYLVRSSRKLSKRSEAALDVVLASIRLRVAEQLGPLAEVL